MLSVVHYRTLDLLHKRTAAWDVMSRKMQRLQQNTPVVKPAWLEEKENARVFATWRKGTQAFSPNKTSIPTIAQLAGVRVGFDSIEQMERRFGKGYAFTGGHPNGAREWRSRQNSSYLNADGFNYKTNGERVLDYVTVTTEGSIGNSVAPILLASRERLLFMGGVEMGMTKVQVRKALQDKLPPPQVESGSWVWRAKGLYSPNKNRFDDVHTWNATLTFAKGKLYCITVGAETE